MTRIASPTWRYHALPFFRKPAGTAASAIASCKTLVAEAVIGCTGCWSTVPSASPASLHLHHRHRPRRDAQPAAHGIEPLVGRGLDRHLPGRDPQRLRDLGPHPLALRHEPRL